MRDVTWVEAQLVAVQRLQQQMVALEPGGLRVLGCAALHGRYPLEEGRLAPHAQLVVQQGQRSVTLDLCRQGSRAK